MTGRFNDGVFLVWSLLYKSDRGDRAWMKF
jgi:hypothetical protein